MGAMQILTNPPQDDDSIPDPQSYAEDALAGGSDYGDPGIAAFNVDTNDPSAWIPDTSQAESALARMRGLSESYLGGEDMGQAFDKIKQSKIAALRAARAAYEAPKNQSDLARLAFGAAMLQPTRTGRLSEGIGSGLSAMLPYIQNQRNVDAYNRAGLANLSSQEAEIPGDIMGERLTAGTDMLQKAQELEFKIQDLKQRGLWNQMSAAARIRAANIMAQARRYVANINQVGSNQRKVLQLVQQAQTLAKQDAQNLIGMHYNLPADQYDAWIDKRTEAIMRGWGYDPQTYQNVLGPGGGAPSNVDPAAAADLSQELSQEAVQRDPGGATPPSSTGANGSPAAAPSSAAGVVTPQPAPAATPDATVANAENAIAGTGSQWSRQAATLTPQEQKDVDTADENTNTLMMAEKGIDDALALNDKAWGGALAGPTAWLDRNLRWVPGYHMPQAAIDTTNYQNIIDQQVLQNLKASFGSTGITEGERAFLKTVQGSINLSPQERKPILERAKMFIAARRRYNEWKSAQVRQGTYRNMSYADFLKATNDPMYMQITGGKP